MIEQEKGRQSVELKEEPMISNESNKWEKGNELKVVDFGVFFFNVSGFVKLCFTFNSNMKKNPFEEERVRG